jgi:Zn-finger nucleic acid-binding protein
MRLVACPGCHAQYDVSGTEGGRFECPCGTTVAIGPVRAVDAVVRRCGSCGALLPEDGDTCAYCRARVDRRGELSLICPECYARNARASRFCTACGVEFRPQPVPDGDGGVACVRCGTPTELRWIGGVAVHECAGCNGLWVPGTAFDDLVNRAIEAWRREEPARLDVRAPRRAGGNPASARVEYRKCPLCGQVMARRNYRHTSGVIIDVCREHGTWLDADELERIAGFILSGGLDRAKAAEETTMRVPDGKSGPSRADAEFERIFQEHRTRVRPHGDGRGDFLLDTLSRFLSGLLDRTPLR